MSVKIENDYLAVRIMRKGAELFSVRNKTNHIEYMWSGDPQFWPRVSPVLFPIVGTLLEDTFVYKGNKFAMKRHGFARDMLFGIEDEAKSSATFILLSNEELLEKYPFHFELRLKYLLHKDSLSVTYEVRNTGRNMMYFSIGGHPAFRTPLTAFTTYQDHYLLFSEKEDIDQWQLSQEGLIGDRPNPLLVNSNVLPLTYELFYQDALVLKNLTSKSVSLKSRAHDYGIDFHFGEFPYLGIWSAPDADFVCIEPWCGLADSVTHDQNLVQKEGIESLGTGQSWSRTWSARFY